jgi:hypothetical protein
MDMEYRELGRTEEHVRAAELPPLTAEAMRTVQEVYDRLIRPQVHQHW